MSARKLTEVAVGSTPTEDTHFLVTQPETVEGDTVESVRRLTKDQVAELVGSGGGSGTGLTEDIKQALLTIAEKVAYIDEHGQDYYDALYNALYPSADLVSISAVFTQGSAVIYDTDSLDTLKQYLVVTAHMSDSSTQTVTSYALSGTLEVGTSTITVSYMQKTTTFNVTVTHQIAGWYYPFEQSILSDGTDDFEFAGTCSYSTGHDGTGYSMYTDTQCVFASGYTPPDLSGDFTIAFWAKTAVAKIGQGLSAFNVSSYVASISKLGTPANIKSGWTVTDPGVNSGTHGCRIAHWSNSNICVRVVNTTVTGGSNYTCTPPSSFDSTTWHHYACTRKGSTFRFFVDGEVIFTAPISDSVLFATQCALGGYYDTSSPTTAMTPSQNKSYYDDLYIAEFCKWDSDFDTSAITY